MKRSSLTLLVAIVVASFSSVAAEADCPAEVGPVLPQYISNCNFDGSSPWNFSGNASLDTPSWGRTPAGSMRRHSAWPASINSST